LSKEDINELKRLKPYKKESIDKKFKVGDIIKYGNGNYY
jgi:hypothetical protein